MRKFIVTFLSATPPETVEAMRFDLMGGNACVLFTNPIQGDTFFSEVSSVRPLPESQPRTKISE